jgi:ABC-type bacteriocin/lantibiotic exporter with double-glycine peptidase domain
MQIIKKIYGLLSAQERKKAALLLVMILIMAALDVMGVASILPFIAILTNPDLVYENPILNYWYTKLGFATSQDFLFFSGVIFFVFLVVSLVFKALTTYGQLHFSLMREFTIGRRLMEGYLNQPYTWFLGRNSSELGKNIISEVQTVVNSAIIPVMTIIAQGTVSVAILLVLIIVDPKLALIVGATLAVGYGVILKLTRSSLQRMGRERTLSNTMRFMALNECFGSIKEVKIYGLEGVFINKFSKPAKILAKQVASSQVVAILPRFFLEIIAFGGLLLVGLYLMSQEEDVQTILPIIALYAFAGYRLMPALQQIYAALTQLSFAETALNGLYSDIVDFKNSERKALSVGGHGLRDCIELKDISFHYPGFDQKALKKINLRIPACKTIGIVGSTGSGKTTVVDLIMGLLEPQEGELLVDGQMISDGNVSRWQRSIGYVPQQIYLSDDTIAANIAFGSDANKIDQGAVERAAKIANLHEFVVKELPEQYQTSVGERGVRLSGGQRQRIGIARALYHNPQVLILDEATSALDNLTEKAVMDAVHNLGHEITIIMIAHRLSTVEKCDIIFLLDKGELKGQGTFEELSAQNHIFQKMSS